MLLNMKIEADNVGQMWGGIFNVACPSPNRPPGRGEWVAVYAAVPKSVGVKMKVFSFLSLYFGRRVVQGLSRKYTGSFMMKVGYVRATLDQPQLWHRDLPLE